MSTFGPLWLDDDHARFRLWAPQAQGVRLLLGEDARHAPTGATGSHASDGADMSDASGSLEGLAPMSALRRAAPMRARAGGWYELDAPVSPGTTYAFEIAGPDGPRRVPDPASQMQVDDVHGPSVVVRSQHVWRHPDWIGRPWHEATILETHVGLHGGFTGLRAQLAGWAARGITAIELMPIADFPGPRNWGYDGVLPFAPDGAYGEPDELRALIDEAHGLGLMVLLDVVYNHFGPEGNHLHRYARDFFRSDVTTPWGEAIDFRRREVRRFYIENALYWIEAFRFDGLRIDAAHAIGAPDWLEEMAGIIRGRQGGRQVHLVLEHDENAAHHLRGGFDAQWNDDAHHVLHTLLTGERDGYYADYADRTGEGLARWLGAGFIYQGEPSAHRGGLARGEPSGDLPPTAFVSFLQNHDQIGNRAHGERLTRLADPRALRVAAGLVLLSPQIPLLFDGELEGSDAPFLYFTSHPPALADAVREGRRREFSAFADFSDEALAQLADPNEPLTFERSHPTRSMAPAPDPAAQTTPTNEAAPAAGTEHTHWLRLRQRVLTPALPGARALGARALGPAAVSAAWRLGDGRRWLMLANLGPTPVDAPFAGAIGTDTATSLEVLAWFSAAPTPSQPDRPQPGADLPLPAYSLLVLAEAPATPGGFV